jgi:hypothetical protein
MEKMIPSEIIPGMEGRGTHCNNFCGCHNIHPSCATVKKNKLRKEMVYRLHNKF